jgi:mono/diheme cytochrome c family protein
VPVTSELRGVGERQGSAVALARQGDQTVALIADDDGDAIQLVDVAARRWRSVTPMAGAPSALVVLDDGRVIAALRDDNAIVMLELRNGALVATGRASVPSEPLGLAVTRDQSTLVVASGWGRRLSAFAVDDLALRWSRKLAAVPRAVIIDDARRRALVTHATAGTLSAVSLDRTEPPLTIDLRIEQAAVDLIGVDEPAFTRPSNQGYAIARLRVAEGNDERFAVPLVSVNPGKRNQGRLASGYGVPNAWWDPPVMVPYVAVVDPARSEPLSRALVDETTSEIPPRRRCLLPRAAASHGHMLLVACTGSNEILELDGRAIDPMRALVRRFSTPGGPTALAVDHVAGVAVVLARLSAELAFVDLKAKDEAKAVTHLALAQRSAAAEVARGRELFFSTTDPRISLDGRACASCHLDGRSDGLTWTTPDGPRQTIALAGRIRGSGPFGWLGRNRDLTTHIAETMARLGGRGLDPHRDRDDLRALIVYLGALERPKPAPDPTRIDAIARGKRLFDDPAQGCASCHPAAGSDGRAHDVKSGDPIERSLAFDTPSLALVAGTAPYFHDGRYPTLRALLVASDGRMGHTRNLVEGDLDALEAYLESLDDGPSTKLRQVTQLQPPSASAAPFVPAKDTRWSPAPARFVPSVSRALDLRRLEVAQIEPAGREAPTTLPESGASAPELVLHAVVDDPVERSVILTLANGWIGMVGGQRVNPKSHGGRVSVCPSGVEAFDYEAVRLREDGALDWVMGRGSLDCRTRRIRVVARSSAVAKVVEPDEVYAVRLACKACSAIERDMIRVITTPLARHTRERRELDYRPNYVFGSASLSVALGTVTHWTTELDRRDANGDNHHFAIDVSYLSGERAPTLIVLTRPPHPSTL